jgi:molybdopterin-guanine dinucleotide biosynthesis protein A
MAEYLHNDTLKPAQLTVAGAILAGGRASRYGGTAKGLLECAAGIPIIEKLIGEMTAAGITEIIILANDPQPYRSCRCETVPDVRAGIGPLGGIKAALAHYAARREAVLFLPCDLPAITANEMTLLMQSFQAEEASIIVAEGNDFSRHSLCTVVHTGMLDQASRAIENGKHAVHRVWRECGALPNVFSGYQKVTDETIRSKFAEHWGIDADQMDAEIGHTVTTMIEACGDDIKTLYVMGENPMMSDADLPAVAFIEKIGTYANTERRVPVGRAAITPPKGTRQVYEIIADIAALLGHETFPRTPAALFDEIKRLIPSYHGMTYERLEPNGLRWPCPTEDHPGTPILHVDKFVRGKGLLTPLQHKPSAEEIDVRTGDKVRVETRRGTIDTHATVTDTVSEGPLYIPFHFVEAAANRLTNDALDPVSKIPEYKICAARISKAE